MKKCKCIIISVLLVLVLVGCSNKDVGIYEMLDNGAITKSIEEFKHMSEDDQKKVVGKVSSDLDENLAIYFEEDRKYDLVEFYAMFLDRINIDDLKYKDILNQIEKLKSSRSSFSKGEALEEEKRYARAVFFYNNVIKTDVNYKEAQENIQKLVKKMNDDELINVQSAWINKTYNSKSLTSRFINKSKKKTFTEVKLVFVGFDKNGKQVKMHSSEKKDAESKYLYTATAKDISLYPNARRGYGLSWPIGKDDSVVRVECCVKSAKYGENKTWKNQRYEYWVSKYKTDSN